jgi:ATPase family AAA domain-containing protein 3A/B
LQEKTRVDYDERKKLEQQRAQVKSQMSRYEDELARKRMQADHEAQRVRNQELVKMQEESAIRQEQMRRAIEEQIQEERRKTDRAKAIVEKEIEQEKILAEANARIKLKKQTEDVERRLLIEGAKAEKEKWVQLINTTFEHIGGGLQTILTDQNKLVVAVGGVTALAAGIYTTR